MKFQNYHHYFLSDEFFNSTQDLVNKSRGFNLANFIDFSAFKAIITTEIDKIEIEDLLDSVLDCVVDLLIKYAKESFEYPELNSAIIQVIHQFGKEQYEKAKTLMHELMSMEKSVVYTCNPYYMDMIDKVKIMRKQMDEQVEAQKHGKSVAQPVTANSDANYADLSNFMRAHYNNDMSTITMQISCFSYWKVFEKRLVDYLHMTIISKLLLDFRSLESVFDRKFAPNTNEQAFKWMSEDRSVSNKREKLEKSLKAFEEAQELIRKIC